MEKKNPKYRKSHNALSIFIKYQWKFVCILLTTIQQSRPSRNVCCKCNDPIRNVIAIFETSVKRLRNLKESRKFQQPSGNLKQTTVIIQLFRNKSLTRKLEAGLSFSARIIVCFQIIQLWVLQYHYQPILPPPALRTDSTCQVSGSAFREYLRSPGSQIQFTPKTTAEHPLLFFPSSSNLQKLKLLPAPVGWVPPQICSVSKERKGKQFWFSSCSDWEHSPVPEPR